MRVQPSKGRYFPLTPSEFIASTRDWPLAEPDVYPPRQLKNPHADTDPQQLVALYPRRFVIVFSLPVTVDPVWGKEVIFKSLALLSRWKAEPPFGGGHFRSIGVYLHSGTTLRVVDERVTFAPGKYFGLEGSRRPKVTSRTTTELASLALEAPANQTSN
jgi:hypothetical protein